ncbi:MAG TPA: hypothetical protein VJ801_00870 [Polyangia bacterium]|nr:hypothetical protein [Polyangia bacterium]
MQSILSVEGNGSVRWIARTPRDARGGWVPQTAHKEKARWLTEGYASAIDFLASDSGQPRPDATALARQRIDRRPRLSWLQAACPASLSLPPTPVTPTPNDALQSARSIGPDLLLRAVRKAFNGSPHGR